MCISYKKNQHFDPDILILYDKILIQKSRNRHILPA